MPVFPGQMRYIRKNMFHAVYVLDPASACGAEASLYLTFHYLLFFRRGGVWFIIISLHVRFIVYFTDS